jgi:hypothetical protein
VNIAGGTLVDPELSVEDRLRRKEERLHAEANRSLDPWERYRALVDALEQGFDHVELADRKARFALVIMGALNLVFFLVATRADIIRRLADPLQSWVGVYVMIYAAVALFFFLEAIESLRPRRVPTCLGTPSPDEEERHPLGLRDYEDAAAHTLDAYRRAWGEVRLGQLNAELAVQNHALARVNVEKYRSLRRLFVGLRVLTVLAGGLLAIVAVSLLLQRQRAAVAEPAGHRAPALVESTAPPARSTQGSAEARLLLHR